MIDDRDLERNISSTYDGIAPAREPKGLLDNVLLTTGQARQRPAWLAYLKEPSMRTSSQLVVGSPTFRVAAILVATLLLALMVAGAGIAGSRLLAADGMIVVDQNDPNAIQTVTEAVAMAEDGDEILVKPGTYMESVTITRDISLRGEDRDSVIIEFGGEGSPQYVFFANDGPEEGPFGILIQDSDAEISDFTVRGPHHDGATGAVVVSGGAPLVHHITVEGNQWLYVEGGSSATVSDSDFSETWVFLVDSPATFENSEVAALSAYTETSTEGLGSAIIRGNRAFGITLERAAVAEGNTLIAPDESFYTDKVYGSGIDVQSREPWVVRDNTINGYVDDIAIDVASASAGEISGNMVNDAMIGLSLGSADHVVQQNEIAGVETGIVIGFGASPSLVDNAIEASSEGLRISGSARPTLSGNTICGAAQNLVLADGAEPVIDDTNEICEGIGTAG